MTSRVAFLVAVGAGTAITDGAPATRANAAARVATSDPERLGRTIRPRAAVDLKALHGHGAVAVSQGHSLYIADGDAPPNGTLRRIENGAIVRAIAWSHDGRYLAFASRDALRIVRRDRRTSFDDYVWPP